jgi:transposase
MKKRKSKDVVFKPYTMGQLQLPTNLEDLIPENHIVRVVNETIEKMDLAILMKPYKGGGTSSFHPKMMLKVLIYAYTQRIYSSRQIAKALRENVNFMWISANNRPDFRTINRFRGVVMREIMEEVFTAVVALLIEEGYVKLEHYFLDGTKLEANANKYTAVWAKSTGRYKDQLEKKIKELLDDIDRVNEEEDEEYGDRDLEELGEGRPIDAEKIEKKMRELNERLRKEPKDKKLSKVLRKLERDYLPRLKKYEKQEEKLGDRNSYSRTDEDATFMRMKGEPPGGKVWPKPGYNIQIGTEDQFVVGYSVHQRPGDFCCFVPHLEKVKDQLGELPGNVIADGGYGSEENYDYLESAEVGAYVKYKTFHQEQTKKYKNNPFLVHNLAYEEGTDEFLCPAGRRLIYQETSHQETESGYVIVRRHYECEDCQGCALREQCTRATGNRRIQISFQLEQMKNRARANLHSEKGKELRSRRGVEVESVFGRLKWNWGFRRFLLRGKEKVEIEWGLLCIAHNMAKMAV